MSFSADKTVRIWDLSSITGELVATTIPIPMKGDTSPLCSISSNRKLLAVKNGRSVQLWDVYERQIQDVAIPGSKISQIGLDNEGQLLALASEEGYVTVLDVRTGKPVFSRKTMIGVGVAVVARVARPT